MNVIPVVLIVLLIGITIFQLLLALGFPYGAAAYGGQQGDVLPVTYRVGSFVSSVIFIFLISVVLSHAQIIDIYSDVFENTVILVGTVFFGINIVMNAISKSNVERMWAPYVAIIFVLSLLLIV